MPDSLNNRFRLRKMLVRKEHIDNDTLLGITEIACKRAELLSLLPQGLRQSAAKQLSKMRSERRIVEWLTVRVLLFELLGEEKIIGNTPLGKPFLEDQSYEISISHTGNYAAVLLNKRYPVGIDVEMISDRISRIAGKFISAKEYIDPEQKIVHQLLHWSAKETLFKLLDEREIDFREHLSIEPFVPQGKGVFHASESKTELRKTFRIHYEILPRAVLTWTVDK